MTKNSTDPGCKWIGMRSNFTVIWYQEPYIMEEGVVIEIWKTTFQTSLTQRFESGLLTSDADTYF
jgi:hypothetical protein